MQSEEKKKIKRGRTKKRKRIRKIKNEEEDLKHMATGHKIRERGW